MSNPSHGAEFEKGFVICCECGTRVPVRTTDILKFPKMRNEFRCKDVGWCNEAKEKRQ